MLEKIGGRKVAIGLLMVGVAVAIEFLGPKGLSDTMSSFLVTLSLGYFAANSLVHGTSAISTRKGEVTTPAQEVDLEPVLQQIAETKAAIAQIEIPAPIAPQDQEEVKKILSAIVNQNAVIAQTVGQVGQATSYLVNLVNANKQQ